MEVFQTIAENGGIQIATSFYLLPHYIPDLAGTCYQVHITESCNLFGKPVDSGKYLVSICTPVPSTRKNLMSRFPTAQQIALLSHVPGTGDDGSVWVVNKRATDYQVAAMRIEDEISADLLKNVYAYKRVDSFDGRIATVVIVATNNPPNYAKRSSLHNDVEVLQRAIEKLEKRIEKLETELTEKEK